MKTATEIILQEEAKAARDAYRMRMNKMDPAQAQEWMEVELRELAKYRVANIDGFIKALEEG